MLDTKVPLRRFGKPEEVADLYYFYHLQDLHLLLVVVL